MSGVGPDIEISTTTCTPFLDHGVSLNAAKEENAEAKRQLDLAPVSWNPATSTEKTKFQVEIQDLKEATARPTGPEDGNMVDIAVYQAKETRTVEANMKMVRESASELNRDV